MARHRICIFNTLNRAFFFYISRVQIPSGPLTINDLMSLSSSRFCFSKRYKVEYECSFNPCPIIRKTRLGLFYLNYPVLNFGAHVVTKPIRAQITHEFFEFFTSYRLYQIAIGMVAICACNVPFAGGSRQHDNWYHSQFIRGFNSS